MGLNYQDSSKIQRIPPMTASETIDFYSTGKVPERFADSSYAKRREILRHYGAIREDDTHMFDDIMGGLV